MVRVSRPNSSVSTVFSGPSIALPAEDRDIRGRFRRFRSVTNWLQAGTVGPGGRASGRSSSCHGPFGRSMLRLLLELAVLISGRHACRGFHQYQCDEQVSPAADALGKLFASLDAMAWKFRLTPVLLSQWSAILRRAVGRIAALHAHHGETPAGGQKTIVRRQRAPPSCSRRCFRGRSTRIRDDVCDGEAIAHLNHLEIADGCRAPLWGRWPSVSRAAQAILEN